MILLVRRFSFRLTSYFLENVIISAANEHILTINMNTSEIKAKFWKENKHKHITYIQLFNYKETKTLAAGFFIIIFKQKLILFFVFVDMKMGR